jgi:beta-carotene ketolase (CrtO type)
MNVATTGSPPVADYSGPQRGSHYDVVVVGGGHNGLTCAAFLAKAGKRVLVLEARDNVGGLCWTREMDRAPGFHVSPGALEFLLTGVQPSVIDQLDLGRYGLRWVYPPALTTGLFPDGSFLPFYRDRQKTIEAIKPFSRRDAVRYGELVDGITAALDAAMPYFQGHPFRVAPQAMFKTFQSLARGHKRIAAGARALISSIDTVLEEHFTREEIKGTLGSYSLGGLAPVGEPGGGIYMCILTGIHEWGVRRPVGGSGMFPRALAACIVDHGGEVRTGAPVVHVNVHRGRANGVVLADGEEIRASQVVASTDPHTLCTKLLDPGDVPLEVHEQIRGLQVGRHGIYIFNAQLALSARPRFPRHGDVDPQVLSNLTLCPSLDYMRQSGHRAMVGEYDDRIPLTTCSASVIDRTLVPPGSEGETLYLYAYNTPEKLSGGRSWNEQAKRDYFGRMMKIYEAHAPGTGELILDEYLTSPPEFESRHHLYKGNYSHADLTFGQMGPWRPVPALAGYRTPIDGLWHTGSGAFPMSYVSGWPGRNTAREVARALDRVAR